MFVEIFMGSCLMLINILTAGLSFWAMETLLVRVSPWFMRAPHSPKLMLALIIAALWSLWLVTAGVWVWALAFDAMGLFQNLEEAVYFSLVTYTTLGFGDVLLPLKWRLLAGMAAANGLLNMGLLVAVLVEAIRHVRLGQLASRQTPTKGS